MTSPAPALALLAPAALALGAGLVLTPLVRAVSVRRGWVERPGVRRVHARPLPRTGGLAVALSLLVAMAAGALLGAPLPATVVLLLASSAAVFAIGWIDDVRGAGARSKLLVQTGAASALCAAGLRFDSLPLPGGGVFELGILAAPLTVLWLVGISNAQNLIDGSDGLAASLVVVAAALAALTAFLGGDLALAGVAAALAAAAAGFLVHNTAPASIHLGDGGSLGLGFLLGGLVVAGSGLPGEAALAAVAAPGLVLAVPAADLVLCALRRRLVARPIVAPDAGHVHHHLLARGVPPSGVVLRVTGVALAAGVLGAATAAFPRRAPLLLLAGAALIVWFLARVGHFRLGPLLATRRRRREVDARHRETARAFEHLQLVLWGASDVEAWWSGLERAAEELRIQSIEACVITRGGVRIERRFPAAGEDEPAAVSATIPAHPPAGACSAEVRVTLRGGGAMEAVGERLKRFARLVEEPPPDWARLPVPIEENHPREDGARQGPTPLRDPCPVREPRGGPSR